MKKTFLKLFVFLILGLSLYACNQAMLGTMSAAKNFITTPYRGVMGAISDYQYSNLRSDSDKARQNSELEDSICYRRTGDISQEAVALSQLGDRIREMVCTCKAWGTCTKDECPCEKLCPYNFKILKRFEKIENLSSESNSLAFRNPSPYNQVGTHHTSQQGFCWGHAAVTNKFNRLGFFDKSKKPPFSLSSEDPKEQEKAIDYYKEKIEEVLDNQATEIPGFANLQDFSDHPAIQGYLGDRVGEEWADNAMTFQGLTTVMSDSPMSRKDNEKLFAQVKERIDNNQQPQIVFTKKGSMGATHTVLVSHYKMERGRMVLCIRDNNVSPRKNQSCSEKMYLKRDGSIYYNSWGWGDIGGIKIAHNNNSETVSQVASLHEKCTQDKGCED